MKRFLFFIALMGAYVSFTSSAWAVQGGMTAWWVGSDYTNTNAGTAVSWTDRIGSIGADAIAGAGVYPTSNGAGGVVFTRSGDATNSAGSASATVTVNVAGSGGDDPDPDKTAILIGDDEGRDAPSLADYLKDATPEQLEKITTLRLSDNITDLTGIEKLTGLKVLDLTAEKIVIDAATVQAIFG